MGCNRSLSSERLRLGVCSRELVSRKTQEKMAKLVDLLYDWYWDTRTHTYIREGNKYKQPNEWKNKKEKGVLQQRVEGNQKINQRDLVVNRAEPSGDMRRLCRLSSGRVSSTERLKKKKEMVSLCRHCIYAQRAMGVYMPFYATHI